MPVQDAKSGLKTLVANVNFQSHWRLAGCNFEAPKNMGGLCFQDTPFQLLGTQMFTLL